MKLTQWFRRRRYPDIDRRQRERRGLVLEQPSEIDRERDRAEQVDIDRRVERVLRELGALRRES